MKSNIFPIILLILLSCNKKQSYQDYINDLRKINPQIKNGTWKIFNKIEYDDEKLYQQYLIEGDTTYTLNFFVYSKSMMKKFNYGSCYNFELYKKYFDTDYEYELKMQNNDTLYFFKSSLKNKNNRFFYVGKYYFLYENGILTPCQTKYYKEHFDSLNRVKGNNIPEIPCIK